MIINTEKMEDLEIEIHEAMTMLSEIKRKQVKETVISFLPIVLKKETAPEVSVLAVVHLFFIVMEAAKKSIKVDKKHFQFH
jgi:hypothetical protein